MLLGLIPLAAAAQSNLPTCEGPSSSWTHCFSTRTSSANGSKYEGEFKDGRPHGQGTVTGANGLTTKGEFRDGRPHGQVTFGRPDGTILAI